MEVLIKTIDEEYDEVKKSQVKGFVRTRKGKMERVNPFSRKGEKKEMPTDFIRDFAEDTGSAVDLWGDSRDHEKIWKLKQTGHKFKAIQGFMSEDKFDKRLSKLKADGWKEFDRGENIDNTDVLMYKKK